MNSLTLPTHIAAPRTHAPLALRFPHTPARLAFESGKIARDPPAPSHSDGPGRAGPGPDSSPRQECIISIARILDAVAYSSLLAGCVAAGLVAACGRALDPQLALCGLSAEMALAFTGTLFVYNIDRLRDLERDLESSPLRCRFVGTHRRALGVLAAAAGLAAGAIAASLGAGVWALCTGALGLGLMHRRLKSSLRLKSIYVTGAWTAVVVGLPALAGAQGIPPTDRIVWVALCGGSAIAANLIASNLRGPEPTDRSNPPLRRARALAGLGALAAVLGPPALLPLAAVPAAELLALAGFRSGERYRLWAVDGALLAGSLGTLALSLTGT